MLEQGLAKEARPYSSMCKDHVANTLLRVLDDAIQLHGALGTARTFPSAPGTATAAAPAWRMARTRSTAW